MPRHLQRALAAQADRDVELALRVAVLLLLDRRQAEIRQQLGISQVELREVLGRLRRVAPLVDRDLDFEF